MWPFKKEHYHSWKKQEGSEVYTKLNYLYIIEYKVQCKCGESAIIVQLNDKPEATQGLCVIV